ncbi:MAG: sigma-70 family RNA polymerase sigma factor [Ruminococcus sp.]|nr:sigma-70 family RNA polymerase sigma factor [Ruminococcus sp.]
MTRDEMTAAARAAAGGDKDAFERLYNEYHDRIYFFVLKNVRDTHAAEDITQDTFVRSMEKIGELDSPEAYLSWLHSIAYNKCRDLISDRDRSAYFNTDEEYKAAVENTALCEPLMLPEDAAVNSELKQTLKKAIDKLPADQRSAVILYYYDDLSIREVADSLKVSENSAALKLHRARKKLRNSIEKHLGGGALCAVPMGQLMKSAVDQGYAAVLRSGRAAVSSTLAAKIAGFSAAGLIAVSVPVGLALHSPANGPSDADVSGTVNVSETEVPYIPEENKDSSEPQSTEPEVQNVIDAELVKYERDSRTMLIINEPYGLCTARVPDIQAQELEEDILVSGVGMKIKWSGNVAELYPAMLEDVEWVKLTGENVRTFVEPYFDDLLSLCGPAYRDGETDYELINETVSLYSAQNNVFPNFTAGEVSALCYLIENELYIRGETESDTGAGEESGGSDIESEPLAETFALQAEGGANALYEIYGIGFDTGTAEWDHPEDMDINDTAARDESYDFDHTDTMTAYDLLKYTLWYFQYNLTPEIAAENAAKDITLTLDRDSSGQYRVTYCKFADQEYRPEQ